MCSRACAGRVPGCTCARRVALPAVPGRMGSAHGENGEAEGPASSAVHNDVFTASVHRRSNDSTHGKTYTAARARSNAASTSLCLVFKSIYASSKMYNS
jgi:hypothetical protein